ncbi:hypothetical protein [Bradyrhizobium sp. SZCCHNRI1073]|uniref:hypothetical protein n=1 Tax=Bradyrhizobium sp. SZCCHNRI1073 TaxID=3057280 RepID=UPI0029161CC9|nr:hypothetical protein [Bradyrhizobium sp. SZCCHNRI1073]
MAQNSWINVTSDKAAANRPSPNSHSHSAVGGTAATADFTISYDSAVVTSLAIFDTLVAAARLRAISGGLK